MSTPHASNINRMTAPFAKMLVFRRLTSALARTTRVPRRVNSTYQPPDPSPKSSNPHREFYKTFGRPVAKNFLIAVATYQVLYWSWLKLESLEYKKDKEEEMADLEGELRSLSKSKSVS